MLRARRASNPESQPKRLVSARLNAEIAAPTLEGEAARRRVG